jgi:ArsR family transcriptional regulator
MTSAVTFFQALADPTRWRIVRLVMDQALCVCELADILKMPQSSVSSHVQIIRKAGLLECETCGKWTYFRIHADSLPLLKSALKKFPKENQHRIDTERAITRLAERETSCCQGPKKLIRNRRSQVS